MFYLLIFLFFRTLNLQNCGCPQLPVDGFISPDYADSSKAGFYHRVLLEEAKQIVVWWVENLNIFSNSDEYQENRLQLKNFKVHQINAKFKSDSNKIYRSGNIFLSKKYSVRSLCPFDKNNVTKFDLRDIKLFPQELDITDDKIENLENKNKAKQFETKDLQEYMTYLQKMYPYMIDTFILFLKNNFKLDTFFDSVEMRTLLNIFSEKCFSVEKGFGQNNLYLSFDYLNCYYKNNLDQDNLTQCLQNFFSKAARFCGFQSIKLIWEEKQEFMIFDKLTPLIRGTLFYGINYLRTMYEAIITKCDLTPHLKKNDTTQFDKIKGCSNLRAQEVQSRKNVAKLGYQVMEKDNNDYISFGFCLVDDYPLNLKISYEVYDGENLITTKDFIVSYWINLEVHQAKNKKQAIQGAGLKNCDFFRDSFMFKGVIKSSEINTICNKTIQVLYNCFQQSIGSLSTMKNIDKKSKTVNPSYYCQEDLYKSKNDFLGRPKPQKKPKPEPKPKPKPEPEPIPILYYDFTINEFQYWISTIQQNQQIVTEFKQMYKTFNENSKRNKIYIEFEQFFEMYNNLKFILIADDGGKQSFYKVDFPYRYGRKNMIYKFTNGYIKYKDKIVFRINFYKLTDITKAKQNHPKPYNSLSTEFCFELELSLTTTSETYFECNNYPEIDVPPEYNEIPWDYNFQVYIYVFRMFQLYLWKLHNIIQFRLTPFYLFEFAFTNLTISDQQQQMKLMFYKDQKIYNKYGLYYIFYLDQLDLIDFSLQIQFEGDFLIKTYIKTGYIEYYFYIHQFFEYQAQVGDGVDIDFDELKNQLQLAKDNYLDTQYVQMLKFYFLDILRIYNQSYYDELYQELNITLEKDYGILEKYMKSEMISFNLFALLLQYHILKCDLDMIDITSLQQKSIQIKKTKHKQKEEEKIKTKFNNKDIKDQQIIYQQLLKEERKNISFIYKKDGQDYQKIFNLYKQIHFIDSQQTDKPIEKNSQQILEEFKILLEPSETIQYSLPLYFYVGYSKTFSKLFMTLYYIQSDIFNSALLVIESQFYYKEILIPLAAPIQMSQKIQQVLQETLKNELEYMNNKIILSQNLIDPQDKRQMDYILNIEKVQELLIKANQSKEKPINFCQKEGENNEKKIVIYGEMPDLFSKQKTQNKKIQICKKDQQLFKIIEIEDTVFDQQPSIKISIAEPNSYEQKMKINFYKGFHLKRNISKLSMMTQLIFRKQRQQQEIDVIENFLSSQLEHIINNKFEELKKEIKKQFEEFLKSNNQNFIY